MFWFNFSWSLLESIVRIRICETNRGPRLTYSSVSRLNVSGRNPGGDYVSVLNIDDPGTDGLFGLHQLKPKGYAGAIGDGTLDLHGFDVEVVNSETLRFWMINHRPPVDANKKYLDATKAGANSTVEVFEVIRGSDEMVHIKTIADKAIDTPNKLAVTGNGGFVITNDKSSKGKKPIAFHQLISTDEYMILQLA